MVIVTADDAGAMPGGASLPEAEFLRLCTFITAHNRSACFDFDTWNRLSPHSIDAVDLALSGVRIDPAAVGSLHRALASIAPSRAVVAPEPLRRLAPRLAQEALTGEVSPKLLGAIVGAGPGTTPTGDDVVVGVLAGLRARGASAAADALGAHVLPLIAQTTAASRHYLRAAIDGRFGEHIHEAVGSLVIGRPAAHTIERAARWGATSGIDLLFGLTAGASAIENDTANRSRAA